MSTPSGPVLLRYSRVREGGVAMLGLDEQPVWPIRNEEELAALELSAESFGLHLREVEPDGRLPVLRSELVAGIGTDAEVDREGRLFANLTRRRYARLVGVSDLALTPDARVVVLSVKDITLASLEELFRHAVKLGGLGVLLLYDDLVRDRIQVLSRAAAGLLPLVGRGGPSWIAPGNDLPRSANGLMFANADTALGAMQSGASLLGLLAHSDGLDADLGEGTVLCSAPWRAPSALRLAPNCVITQFCTRRQQLVSQARDSGRLLSPDVLDCRVAIFLICFGVLAEESLTDPTLGLLRALVHNPRLGATITAWDAVLPSFVDLFRISGKLLSGISVGASAVETSLASGDRLRLLVLGDPDVALAQTAHSDAMLKTASQLEKAQCTNRHVVGREDRWRGRVRMFESLVTRAEERSSDPQRTALALSELKACSLKQGRWTGSDVIKLTEVMLPVLLATVPMPHILLAGTAAPRFVPSKSRCFSCERALRVFVWDAKSVDAVPRICGLCARCTVVVDAEAEEAVASGDAIWRPFSIERGVLTVTPQLLNRAAGIAIWIKTPDGKKHTRILERVSTSCTLPCVRGVSVVSLYALLEDGQLLLNRAMLDHRTLQA